MKSGKKVILQHITELQNHFRQTTELVGEPVWQWGGAGLVVELDHRLHRFFPRYELKPSHELLERLELNSGDARTLLVTVDLNSRLLEVCRRRGLSAVDLNGRLYLRAEGLLVDQLRHSDTRFVYELEPRNVFVGKSGALVRTLLTNRDQVWTQAEVQKRGDASSGLASRVFGYLVNQGFLEKVSPREYRLSDPQGLVDAWCRADKFSDRASTVQYAAFGALPTAIAMELADWAKTTGVDIAFTRWIAGFLRVPYTEPVIVSAYVSRLPTTQELSSLGFTQVSEGGTIALHLPTDSGVFREKQIVRILPLVSDAQIVVDLQGTGLRGPDQSKALRESTKFCRP